MRRWRTGPWHHSALRYGLAAGAVGTGFLLRLGLTSLVGEGLPTYITFYPAVMVAGLLGGFGPGLVATALTGLVTACWILPPQGFVVADVRDLVGLGLFSFMGLSMSAVAELYRRTRVKAAAYDQEMALREIRREKDLLASLLEHASQPFAVGYPDGRMGRCNAAYEELTGYSAAELRALDWSAVLTPPEWREMEMHHLGDLQRTGQPVRYEKEYLRKDGTRVPVELLVHLVRDAAGQPEYYYSFLTDITQRKAVEQAAHQSAEHQRQLNVELEAANAALLSSRGTALNMMEDAQTARDKALAATAEVERERHLLRTLIDLIPDAIFVRDAQDRFLVANVMMTRAAGASSPEAMLGKTDAEFFRADLSSGFRADDQRVLAGETILNKEERVPFPAEGERILLTTKVPFRDRTGAIVGLVGVARDITERKRAQEALARVSLMLAEGQRIAHLGSFEYVVETRTTVWSEEEFRIYGLDPAGPAPAYEVMLAQCIHPDDAARLHQTFTAAMQSRSIYELEHRIVRPDGSMRIVHDKAHPYCDADGRLIRYVGATLDITERKQAEAALLQANDRLALAQRAAHAGAWDWDIPSEKLTWTKELFQLFGLNVCLPTFQLWRSVVHPEDREAAEAHIRRALQEHTPLNNEYRIVRPDGEIRWLSAPGQTTCDDSGQPVRMTGICIDITERKQAEAARIESEARYHSLFNTLLEGFCIIEVIFDPQNRPVDYRFLEVNPTFEQQTGLHNVQGRLMRELAPDHEDHWFETYGQIALTGEPARFVNEARQLGRWFDVSAYRLGGAESRKVAILFNDITARKQREDELRQFNRALTALARSNEALMRVTEEGAYLQEVCRIVVEDCGHAMVWIGHAEDDADQTVRPMAYSGFEEGYLETLQVTWADTERGRGPTGTAIRTGKPCACRNMLTDPQFAPWREQALQRGYASSLVLPLRDADKTFGSLSIYSRQPNPFSEHEVELLGDLADDLAHGITTLRLRAAQAEAEAALRDNEATLRGILNATQESVWLFSPEGRVLMANEVAFIRFGQPAADVVGKLMIEILPPEMARTRMAKLREAVESTRPLEWEDERSGILFHHCFYPVLDAQGQVVSVACFSKDITERKQAEAALRELSQRLSYHVDNSPLAVIEWGADMRLTRWSGEAEHIFGWKAEEVLGKRMTDFRWIYPEDESKVIDVSDGLQTGTAPRRFSANRNYRKDGSVVYCEWYNSSLLDESGQLRSILSLVLDVTARKEAERLRHKFELLVSHSTEFIGMCDLKFVPFYVNEAGMRLVGLESQEQAFATPVKEFFFPEDQAFIYEGFFPRVMREGSGEVEIRFRHFQTGAPIWMIYGVFFLKNVEGQPVGLATVSRDISARKQAEEQIRTLNTQLEQRVRERTAELAASNKELEAFCYSVSHDLRAPLRGIDGFSLALLEDYSHQLDARGQDYLARVRRGCQSMGTLIDDLLNLSRLTRSAMHRAPVDLSALAERIEAGLRLLEPQRQVEFRITPGLTAAGDEHLLEAVLQNLLGNAWKYTGQRERAEIEFGVWEKPSQGVGGKGREGDGEHPAHGPVFFVRDNGAGFDMLYADKLFAPFQRLHSATAFPGNGIGLATVQRVILRHGGRIWFEAAVDQGATFYFTLGQ